MRQVAIKPLPWLFSLLLLGLAAQGQGYQPNHARAVGAEDAKIKIIDFNAIVNGAAPGYGPNCYVQSNGEWCYGSTYLGGNGSMLGSLYRVRPDGSSLKTLYSFDVVHGWTPGPSPILDDTGTHLYGTTTQGGVNGIGIVYEFSLADHTISTLATFAGPSGSNSWTQPTLLGTKLYGTASQGGANGYGSVWSVDLSNPSTMTVLHNFVGPPSDAGTPFTSLTYNPRDGLLYGMDFNGGANDVAGIFSLRPDGSDYELRASFDLVTGDKPQTGALTLDPSDGLLYGSGWRGGQNNLGTLFSFDPATNTITPVFSLSQETGTMPYSPPILSKSGNWLYMVTWQGGSNVETPLGKGYGTILAVKKDGSSWHVLYRFTKHSGGLPFAGPSINQDGSRLITTTFAGGKFGVGTLVSLEIPAQFR